MEFVKAGQAKLIAINAAKRSALAPNVPAIAEKSPGFDFAFTVAVLAKTGTPSEAISRLSSEIARIVKLPDVVQQLHTAGVDPVGGTPDDLAKALRAESGRIAAAARHADLKPE
jgi:tripartite-type tricarboxylate transporter receptor subunit TctC